MIIFQYYLLFAISVGIWACIEYIPRIRKTLFEANRLDDPMYDSPYIVFFVVLVVSAVFAPIVFLTIFSEQLRNAATERMCNPKP